ncbi:probable peptidyl-tRNA hydrolase 2 [Amphiura filiformis]|uniref:probable peptidyl-tRNA hydrolase 2 n=1 Tax=Amphiura filiformis TaxID=82378 RepID=UPI003B21D29B
MSGSGERGQRMSGDGAQNPDDPAAPRQPAGQVNQEFLEMLCAMGIDQALATQALQVTGNTSAEIAAAWIFENPSGGQGPQQEQQWLGTTDMTSPVKMVFVVNAELKMGVGKTAAQVAHACLGLYRQLLQNQMSYGEKLLQWENGETKIVLGGLNTDHLTELRGKATSAGLPNYMVQDAGRTQIPAGSVTVLSIFGSVPDVDLVTGELQLL